MGKREKKTKGTIADLDCTVAGEPWHPTGVIYVRKRGRFSQIIMPHRVMAAAFSTLRVGNRVKVFGKLSRIKDGGMPVIVARRVVGKTAIGWDG